MVAMKEKYVEPGVDIISMRSIQETMQVSSPAATGTGSDIPVTEMTKDEFDSIFGPGL